ncbi:MAG: hypothetical protein MUP09_06920, partial [Thiovulaceae bacterium]|nr:hypothetical protein [Sulfurimonadaceae bacterium]
IYDIHTIYEIAGFKAKALYAASHIEGGDKIAAQQNDPLNPNGLSMSDSEGYYLNVQYDVLATAATRYKLPLFIQYDVVDPTKDVADKNGNAVASYDYLDSNGLQTASTNTKETTTTVGLNFFPHAQVVLKMDYAMTNMDAAAAEDYNTFSLGLGFIF